MAKTVYDRWLAKKGQWMFCSSSSRHNTGPQNWKAQILMYRFTEQNAKNSLAYLYSCKQAGAHFSVLLDRYRFTSWSSGMEPSSIQPKTWKQKTHWALSLAVGLFLLVGTFSQPASSKIRWQSLILPPQGGVAFVNSKLCFKLHL